MIWTAFQSAIVDRLKEDAYFVQSPAVQIFAEESEDELTDDSLDAMREAVQKALTSAGIAVVVSEPDYEVVPDSPRMYLATITIAVFENRQANKNATTGAKRSAKNTIAVAHWLLDRFIPTLTVTVDGADVDCQPFTPISIRSGNYIGEEEGIKVRELTIQSRVAVSAVYQVLGTEVSGQVLVNENNQSLFVSPTQP